MARSLSLSVTAENAHIDTLQYDQIKGGFSQAVQAVYCRLSETLLLPVCPSQIGRVSVAQCGSGGADPHGPSSAAGSEDWSPEAALPSLLRGRVAFH